MVVIGNVARNESGWPDIIGGMLLYRQSSGELYGNDGRLLGTGYSGAGVTKNKPDAEPLPNQGPIPRGRYTIGHVYDSDEHGPVVHPLVADEGNAMFGRSGFLIHGDSKLHPGTASKGCIILSRQIREAIGKSGETVLLVLA